MKRLIATTAILLSVGTSTFAMVANDGLSASDAFEARRFVPSADLTDLTPAQANAIAIALHSDDQHVGAQIRSILKWN